ncbi:GNAT family N-acetyltransferase [Desulfonatronum thioautotrophicum]|uniref:GNAT family N-acetyltransferase n=1 Tax=Desulfonatronum thioautotrophicum TaxID=617001 RepID=UPI0005EB1391|nr:GNAT family N-acetyltransferase [Desulfonatronum thioautotrophicum]
MFTLEQIIFRREVRKSDIDVVRRLADHTGFFRPQELAVAAELVLERLSKGPSSGYHFLLAENSAGHVSGYACFGPIPCTGSSFDLYWIIVHPQVQGQGLGKLLMSASEAEATSLGGTRMYVETSSQALYRRTRQFYERCGYSREAVLRDFYAPGDHKHIYCKSW